VDGARIVERAVALARAADDHDGPEAVRRVQARPCDALDVVEGALTDLDHVAAVPAVDLHGHRDVGAGDEDVVDPVLAVQRDAQLLGVRGRRRVEDVLLRRRRAVEGRADLAVRRVRLVQVHRVGAGRTVDDDVVVEVPGVPLVVDADVDRRDGVRPLEEVERVVALAAVQDLLRRPRVVDVEDVGAEAADDLRDVVDVGDVDVVLVVVDAGEQRAAAQLVAPPDEDLAALDPDGQVLRSAGEVEGIRRPRYEVGTPGLEAHEGVAGVAPDLDVVVPFATVDGVGPRTAVDRVVPVVALDRVVPRPAGQRVVAGASRDRVGTSAAVDRVVAGVAEELVVTGPGLDRVVAVSTVDLDGDRGVGDAAQVNEVVAEAAERDDVVDAVEFLRVAAVAVELARPDADRAGSAGDVDLLGDVVQVALDAGLGARADREGQRVAGHRPEESRAVERHVEVEQLQPRELERERNLRQDEVDLDVRAEEELQHAGDVEHGERVAAVRQDVRLHLVEPDLAVVIQVGEVEEDVRVDAALDARADEAERDGCADGDLEVEHALGDVGAAVARTEVAEEEALEQARRVARAEQLLQTERVVADRQLQTAADSARERAHEWPDDRELLAVGHVEPPLRQLHP